MPLRVRLFRTFGLILLLGFLARVFGAMANSAPMATTHWSGMPDWYWAASWLLWLAALWHSLRLVKLLAIGVIKTPFVVLGRMITWLLNPGAQPPRPDPTPPEYQPAPPQDGAFADAAIERYLARRRLETPWQAAAPTLPPDRSA